MNTKSVDFQVLFEKAPGLFLVLLPNTPDYTIIAASEAYLRATMTVRSNILSKSLFAVFPDNPDDPKASGTSNLRASLESVIANKIPDAMAVQKYDIPRPKEAGAGFEERYWSPLNTPVLGENGDILYIIHKVEDITELVKLQAKGAAETKLAKELQTKAGELESEVYRRAQEIQTINSELQKANEKLKELDELKTEFFSNVSHEFRTPLTLMIGPLEDLLADKQNPLTESQSSQLHMIHRNSLRLQKLVNDLLDYSRIEAGRTKSIFQPVDLSGFTKEIASTFKPVMKKAGLNFVINCPPIKEKVYIDFGQWEIIVLNLLSNALKYTLKGSVSISIQEKSGHAQLVVSDSGTGIPKDEIPQLFERFHRISGTRARSSEGSGIGLAMVYELIKLHGGTIEVESKLHTGTTFIINIPFGTAHIPQDQIKNLDNTAKVTGKIAKEFINSSQYWDQSEDTNSKSKQKEAKKVKSKWDQTILVVDDNSDMRSYIKRAIDANTSLSVVTASNGLAALEAIKKKKPSLIITDIMMPVMDGFELVNTLRKDPANAQIPIIYLSARAGEKDKLVGIAEGVDDYLVKPFSSNELVARVQAHLNLAIIRQKHRKNNP